MVFGGDTTLMAPVELPEGVTVTALLCDLYDNDGFRSIQVIADLRQRAYASTSWESVATVSLATSQQGSSTAIQTEGVSANYDIDNGANTYSLVASISAPTEPANNPSLRFYGCRIKYTQSSL